MAENPEVIMSAFREALRSVLGDDLADKTVLYYSKGWYYLNIAQRFPDGSSGAIGIPSGYRRAQIVTMTLEWIGRATEGMNC